MFLIHNVIIILLLVGVLHYHFIFIASSSSHFDPYCLGTSGQLPSPPCPSV